MLKHHFRPSLKHTFKSSVQ